MDNDDGVDDCLREEGRRKYESGSHRQPSLADPGEALNLDPIREGQGVGNILALILVLGRDSVQQPSLRMMDGVYLFLRRLRRKKRRVVEEEAGGERHDDRDDDDVGNGDGLGDGQWCKDRRK